MIQPYTHDPSLLDLPAGEFYVLTGFSDESIASKLLAMGVMPGHKIRILRQVPFGGAVYLEIDHLNIALRRSEAACLLVGKLN